MLQRASPTHRGPRDSSSSASSRGRIQKRKAGPPRVDRDGDLMMDAEGSGQKRKSARVQLGDKDSSGGRGRRGRGSGGPFRAGNRGIINAQQAIMRGLGAKQSQANILGSRITSDGAMLRIDGLESSKAASNPDGGVESLLAFLERKASSLDSKSNRTVKIKKSSMKGDSVIITASPNDIEAIQKLDAFQFAGAPLSIKAYDSPSRDLEKKADEVSPSAQQTKDMFRDILATRYDPTLKLLNLSALAQDPGLINMGVFDGNTTTSKVFPALMAVCDGLFKSRQEKREAIVSVTLADNALVNVGNVSALAQKLPDIKNIDLSRNQISQLSSLDAWGKNFRHITTLILAGNPIEPQLPSLKDELLKRYPYLEILNGIQIRTAEEVAASIEASKFPIPLAAPDFRDVGQVGENFVRQFVPMYDTNRSALLTNYYDAQSVVSISINMFAPRNVKISAPIPPWAAYTKFSRNLVKINNLPTQMSRIHRGSQAINTLWNALPATRHPDLSTQPDKYLIECHPLPGLVDPNGQSPRGVDGLIVTMHGEFEEESDKAEKALRSFSRTFILGPGGPGGPPIIVISDMMTLRAWGPLATSQSAVAAPAPAPAPATATAPELAEQQRQAVAMGLVQRTGLNFNYATLCLQETGWDLEQAFIAFNANKERLPADAFATGNFT
ncbi:putative mRNA export factor MEX67 [Amylocarpus encephaloides]|uniref:mRNA export factor MEX67 n=1 Tax=Amylocarpus encephaloides TaxID=45428 RepID=A0A9P7YQY3_9HELO|nr:putative mRNA export factor MEX67 [Amylocarpus encephaloides]